MRGHLGPGDIAGEGLRDESVLRLLERITVAERGEFTRRFPAERIASVRIALDDGRVLESAPTAARGDADAPLGDDELRAKFELLAAAVPPSRRAAIAAAVEALDRGARLESDLLPLLLAAPRWAGERRQAAGAA